MKFHYKQTVKVVNNFFEGQIGTVIDYDYALLSYFSRNKKIYYTVRMHSEVGMLLTVEEKYLTEASV